MTFFRSGRVALALALIVLLAPLALGAAFVETEKQARTAALDGAGAAFRTSCDGSDSQTYTDTPDATAQTITATGTDATADTLLKVIVRHSTNNQTARIEVPLWGRRSTGGTYRFIDVADVQMSTATNRAYGALFLPETALYFRIAGADKYAVRVTDVSGAGTVDVAAHTCGFASKAAE